MVDVNYEVSVCVFVGGHTATSFRAQAERQTIFVYQETVEYDFTKNRYKGKPRARICVPVALASSSPHIVRS